MDCVLMSTRGHCQFSCSLWKRCQWNLREDTTLWEVLAELGYFCALLNSSHFGFSKMGEWRSERSYTLSLSLPVSLQRKKQRLNPNQSLVALLSEEEWGASWKGVTSKRKDRRTKTSRERKGQPRAVRQKGNQKQPYQPVTKKKERN